VRTIAVRRKRRRHTGWAAAVAVLVVLSAAAVPGMLRRPAPFAAPPTVHSVLTAGTPITVTFPYTLPGATVVLSAGRPTLWDKGFQVWTTSVAPTGAQGTPA